MKNIVLFLSLLCLCSFASCKKHPLDSNGLPPITQEGKNILGFLLNGQVWTPQGNNGTANLSLYYDPTFSGGAFNVGAYRNTYTTNGHRQTLHLFGDSIQGPQKIILPNENKFGFSFWDELSGCNYSSSDSSTIFLGGFFDLQKLDKSNHIFSGEFELSFKKTGCQDIQITQGRFDLKY